MGIVDTGNAPAATAASADTVTSASFTPSASSLLVALVACGQNGTGAEVCTVSDSLTSAWTFLYRLNVNGGTDYGSAEVWMQDIGLAPAARTVTLAGTAPNGEGVGLVVKNFTGAALTANQNGAHPNLAVGAGGAAQISITPTVIGSWLGMVLSYSGAGLTLAANATSTALLAFDDTTLGETYGAATSSAGLTTSLTAVSVGFSTTLAVAQGTIQAIEVVPAVPAAQVGYWSGS